MDNTPLLNWDNEEVDKEMQSKMDKLIDWKNLPDNHFIHVVEKARAGTNVGLRNGMGNLSRYTYGTHKGRYYLIGADSGVGKTTISDFMFVMKAYESAKIRNKKLYIIYYSFEISLEEKKARWASYFIWELFNEVIPADYILGRIEGLMVSDQHMDMIRTAYLYIEQMMEYCHMVVVEDPVHPTRIFHDMIDHHFEKIGTIKREKSHDPAKKGRIVGYTPNPGEEEAVTIKILDHMALLMNEQGFDTKQTMDLASKYDVTLRNLFGLTSVNIQQFNTDITSTYRMAKKGDGLITPQRIDFGDSRYTFRDANVVLGLIKPSIYDIPSYHNYDITKLDEYFIAMHLMKNRHGASQRMLPLFLNAASGVSEDLPLTPQVEIAMEPYYEQAQKLEQICRLYSPKNP